MTQKCGLIVYGLIITFLLYRAMMLIIVYIWVIMGIAIQPVYFYNQMIFLLFLMLSKCFNAFQVYCRYGYHGVSKGACIGSGIAKLWRIGAACFIPSLCHIAKVAFCGWMV